MKCLFEKWWSFRWKENRSSATKITYFFVYFKRFSKKARLSKFLDYELFEKLSEPSFLIKSSSQKPSLGSGATLLHTLSIDYITEDTTINFALKQYITSVAEKIHGQSNLKCNKSASLIQLLSLSVLSSTCPSHTAMFHHIDSPRGPINTFCS